MATGAAALLARSLSAEGRRLLFTEARTNQFFLPEPVPDDKLRELYDLAKFGPTSINCCPLRVLFVKSRGAKEALAACVADGNKPKVLGAPVTAVLAWDAKFYDELPTLAPPFAGQADALRAHLDKAAAMGTQSANLQAAYFILAARSVGLDAGPMGGFDAEAVNKAFFDSKTWRSLLLVNLGYGDSSKVYPRGARLRFEDAVTFL